MRGRTLAASLGAPLADEDADSTWLATVAGKLAAQQLVFARAGWRAGQAGDEGLMKEMAMPSLDEQEVALELGAVISQLRARVEWVRFDDLPCPPTSRR